MTTREARVWNARTKQWELVGTQPGPKGDPGPAGTDGVKFSPTPPENPAPGLLWVKSDSDVPTYDPFPTQTGQSGKVLGTDGSRVLWVAGGGGDSLPDQKGKAGKFLSTNGTSPAWADVPEELPPTAGNEGKFLTNNGVGVSWGTPSGALPSQAGQSGKFLTTNGTTPSWANVPAVPTPAYNDYYGSLIATSSGPQWSYRPVLFSQTVSWKPNYPLYPARATEGGGTRQCDAYLYLTTPSWIRQDLPFWVASVVLECNEQNPVNSLLMGAMQRQNPDAPYRIYLYLWNSSAASNTDNPITGGTLYVYIYGYPKASLPGNYGGFDGDA